MNKNMYIGRLTRDPEIKNVIINGENTPVGKISIAVTNNFKGRDGEYVTTFINNMTVMGENKVKALNTLCKGRLIFVECHLMNNDYTDKNGQKVYSYDFVVDNIQYLDAKPQNNNQQVPQGNYQQVPQGNYQQMPQGGFMPPQNGYQQVPQGNYQQMPQGGFMPPQNGYQPMPQGNYQQMPQGQIPNNLLPPQSQPQGQSQAQPTLEDQFNNGQQGGPDPNAVFGSGNGVAGSNFR